MRFSTYAGARPGIGAMLKAIAAPGGNAYGDTMRDLAYVDSARSSAAQADSETALNQQQYGAREGLAGALQGIPLPAGMTPEAISALYTAGTQSSLGDFADSMGVLRGYDAQGLAIDAARRGDNDSLNRFSTAAKPGSVYTPHVINETASYNAATGAGQFTPGHQALAGQRNAAAGASNAQAGLYRAQTDMERFFPVAPGHSLVRMGQQDAARAPGIIGALPDGRPIVQNDDGSISTHRMATVTDPRLNGGRATNIPTIVNGQTLPPQQALEAAVAGKGVDPYTGKPYASYNSVDDAEVDYMLRQHPQIDREASWQQRQFQQKAGNRVVDTLQQVYQAPMTPNQMGAGSGGGADGTGALQKMQELIAQGVPEPIARGIAYGSIKNIPGKYGMSRGLQDLASGVTIADFDDEGRMVLTPEGARMYAGRAGAQAAGDPLAEARAAIAAGAPRDAVIARLRQNGINPEGL